MEKKIVVEVMRRLEAIFPVINNWTDELDALITEEEAKAPEDKTQLYLLDAEQERVNDLNDLIEQAVDLLDSMQKEIN